MAIERDYSISECREEPLTELDIVRDRFDDLEERYLRLLDAVDAIYHAAYWHPDRVVKNEIQLWEELRDAAGITPGSSSALLGSDLANTPNPCAELLLDNPSVGAFYRPARSWDELYELSRDDDPGEEPLTADAIRNSFDQITDIMDHNFDSVDVDLGDIRNQITYLSEEAEANNLEQEEHWRAFAALQDQVLQLSKRIENLEFQPKYDPLGGSYDPSVKKAGTSYSFPDVASGVDAPPYHPV